MGCLAHVASSTTIVLTTALLVGSPAHADGDITEFQLDANSRPYSLAIGGDGAVWFTEGPPTGSAE